MNYNICLITICVTFLCISCAEVKPDSNPEIDSITEVYKNFEQAVKEKDVTLLESTFISENTQLNAYIRSSNGVMKNIFPLANWTYFLGTMTDPYHIEILNMEIVVSKNMAYSIADFKEYMDGRNISFGKDLFIYIKTSSGWKIASLSNTATVIDSTASLFEVTPRNAFDATKQIEGFLTAIQERDTSGVRSLLKLPSPLVVLPTSDLTKVDKSSLFDVNQFMTELVSNDIQWSFSLLTNRIVDQHLTIAEINYEKTMPGNATETGLLYITLFSEDESSWSITSIVGEELNDS